MFSTNSYHFYVACNTQYEEAIRWEIFVLMFQTAVARRRCRPGVQQPIENGLRSCMYAYMYVYLLTISFKLSDALFLGRGITSMFPEQRSYVIHY